MRIISLCPSNTEALAYIGLTEQLVGTDNYSDWPETILQLPKLGSDLEVDMAAVAELKPDLVVASLTVPGMERNVEALRRLGLPHIVLNPSSLTDIGENLLTIGEAADCLPQAKAAYERYRAVLEGYREKAAACSWEKVPNVYWEWWPKPLFTPGGANWLTEISSLAGGVNAFADVPSASVRTVWSDVVERDPDVICLAWTGIRKQLINPEVVRRRPDSSRIRAVRSDRIHVMDERLCCRPSPRLLEGLELLAELMRS